MTSSPGITRLKESTINQIAAGEVIDRPSGVIRELVENSVDAQAKNISIKINYDDFSISVKDDGIGIPEDQILLAFERHTTSKINDFNDLLELSTLGFRGEALASIASISKVEITTSNSHQGVGTRVILEGGNQVSSMTTSFPKGTEIKISQLFYNTPVRKKFFNQLPLKTEKESIDTGPLVIKSGERRTIKEEIIHQILSTDQIHFDYTSIHKRIEKNEITLPSSFTLKDKILHFFKSNDPTHPLSQTLIPLSEKIGHFEIKGYTTSVHCRERKNHKQYLIIQNRVIRNPYFIKSVQSAYLHKIPSGTHPICFIKVTLPSAHIDMNIHPRKEQVKFRDAPFFFNAIKQSIQNALSKHHFNRPLNPELTPTPKSRSQETDPILSVEEHPLPRDFRFKDAFHPDQEATRNRYFPGKTFSKDESSLSFDQGAPVKIDQEKDLGHGTNSESLIVLGQIAKCYLLFSVGNDLFITDQHAAHERINFDLINQNLSHQSDQQILLVPLLIEKTVLEIDKILEQKNNLEKFGFELEKFGETTLRISKIPAYLPEKKVNLVVQELLELATHHPITNKEEFNGQVTARMACRMSVMAGDFLSRQEMTELIQEIYEKNYLHTCPHGRPFVKKISQKELEYFFDRGRHIV